MSEKYDRDKIAQQLYQGDRRRLARAISEACSERIDHQQRIFELIEHCRGYPARQSFRFGVSGAPGAGKSSLIAALGEIAIERGLRFAAITVDPSSSRSGGAILGDKSRMNRLAMQPAAFIRPQASGRDRSGLMVGIEPTLALIELAGYDLTVIETVGVGQLETNLADLCDFQCLLLSPDSGDELQALKKGAIESADLLVVTKCDKQWRSTALATAQAFKGAGATIFTVSVIEGSNPPDSLSQVFDHGWRWWQKNRDSIADRRQRQQQQRFVKAIQQAIGDQARVFLDTNTTWPTQLSPQSAQQIVDRLGLQQQLAAIFSRLSSD